VSESSTEDLLDKLQDYQHSCHELPLSSSVEDSSEFVDSFAEGLLAEVFVGSTMKLPC